MGPFALSLSHMRTSKILHSSGFCNPSIIMKIWLLPIYFFSLRWKYFLGILLDKTSAADTQVAQVKQKRKIEHNKNKFKFCANRQINEPVSNDYEWYYLHAFKSVPIMIGWLSFFFFKLFFNISFFKKNFLVSPLPVNFIGIVIVGFSKQNCLGLHLILKNTSYIWSFKK